MQDLQALIDAHRIVEDLRRDVIIASLPPAVWDYMQHVGNHIDNQIREALGEAPHAS